ncbi:Hypothetical predicted protein [Olea europaea subsp. europaea]|uniref:Uncharacterized protein n=1 Tax=Olea europaea subsp. europaea TaxID=158383 RepID=A0A8S0SPB5_OLEEU|nr:Hypothetical predicted protein [Olea europaea subsp. europaea]
MAVSCHHFGFRYKEPHMFLSETLLQFFCLQHYSVGLPDRFDYPSQNPQEPQPVVRKTENRKYAKYKNMSCSEIYDTYGKLFGDAGDSTKYALSPSKLSQRGFDLGTDSDKDDGGDKLSINAEGTDSSDSPVDYRAYSSVNISRNRSEDKRKSRHGKDKGKRKKYGAREVSESLEQMVSVGTDLASIARSHQKDDMSIDDCVSELLSSEHVEEGSPLHMFALWFLRVKDNRNSYRAAKTPFLRFKFIECCFERDNQSFPRKG